MHDNLRVEQVLAKIGKSQMIYPGLSKLTLNNEESYGVSLLDEIRPIYSGMIKLM